MIIAVVSLLRVDKLKNSGAYFLVGLYLLLAGAAYGGQRFVVSGVVRDAVGAAVVEATVSMLNAQQAIIASEKTDAGGRFHFPNVAPGSYLLVVNVSGFAEQRKPVAVRLADVHDVEFVVEPRPLSERVTVTANPGTVESVETISQQVNVITERALDERARWWLRRSPAKRSA